MKSIGGERLLKEVMRDGKITVAASVFGGESRNLRGRIRQRCRQA